MFASVVLCAGVLVRFARAVISTLAPIFDPVVRVLSWHRPAWVPSKPVGWADRQVPVTPPPSPASDFEDFPEEESPLFTLPCHTQTPWWIDIGSFCFLCRQPRHTPPTIELEYYRDYDRFVFDSRSPVVRDSFPDSWIDCHHESWEDHAAWRICSICRCRLDHPPDMMRLQGKGNWIRIPGHKCCPAMSDADLF
ncbi:uncharacterized protein LOC107982026 [Nasonia vitripennis]|uniref:Uncharacterized protein n=1 Tax=Nasonia vitripennis TaxID=7425 RepID=A0A7M7J7Q8_NASVI|nr:uncharacterized protein LOC107982026 [Nasonia vitripennis]